MQFNKVTKECKQLFQKYQENICFGDQAFSMLYAWGEFFHYEYYATDDILVIRGKGMEHETEYFLLYREVEIASLKKTLEQLCEQAISNQQTSLHLCYICQDSLESFRCAIEQLGFSYSYEYEEEYSDYIYCFDEFISLSGRRKHSIRGDYNALTKRIVPKISWKEFQPAMLDECTRIFDAWCSRNDCSKCVYGCEKKAFLRFIELYDPKTCFGGVAFDGDLPISFAVGEKINQTTDCYYFQKNSQRIRGLTYWLEKKILENRINVSYINLEEDMGIAGIRQEKQKLHPAFQAHKFSIEIELERIE